MGMMVVQPPTCPDCGAQMRKESPIYGGPDQYVCPVCWGDEDPPPLPSVSGIPRGDDQAA